MSGLLGAKQTGAKQPAKYSVKFGAKLLRQNLLQSLSLFVIASSLLATVSVRAAAPGVATNKTENIADQNLALFTGPVAIAGEWRIDPAYSIKAYRGLTPERFGTYLLLGADGKPLVDAGGKIISPARPLHYRLGLATDGAPLVGYRVLPIARRTNTTAATENTIDGVKITGAEYVDNALSRVYYGKPFYPAGPGTQSVQKLSVDAVEKDFRYLDDNFPIAAIMAYYHPHLRESIFTQIGDPNNYTAQGGFGHMAFYTGSARGLNSPEFLYSDRGGMGMGDESSLRNPRSDPPEPANLYSVRLLKPGIVRSAAQKPADFENPALVNLNHRSTMFVFNDGVVFPPDYTQDVFRGVNLRTVLAALRGWIDDGWVYEDALTPAQLEQYKATVANGKAAPKELTFYQILRTDSFWANYCAEYVTVGTNIAYNLLNNTDGFAKVYGKDGKRLFGLFSLAYKNRTKRNLPLIPNNAFVPLWASDDAIRAELAAKPGTPVFELDAAREWGRSLIWKPLKTIDVLGAFIATYVPWTRNGAIVAAAATLSTAAEAVKRMKIDFKTYKAVVLPIVAYMIADEIAWKNPAATKDEASWTAATAVYTSNIQKAITGAPLPTGASLADWKAIESDLNTALLETDADAGRDRSHYQHATALAKYLAEPAQTAKSAAVIEGEVHEAFLFHIHHAFAEGRTVKVGKGDNEFEMVVSDYTPPMIANKIVQGLHPSHHRFVLEAQGTIMAAHELVRLQDADATNNGRVQRSNTGEKYLLADPLAGL